LDKISDRLESFSTQSLVKHAQKTCVSTLPPKNSATLLYMHTRKRTVAQKVQHKT